MLLAKFFRAINSISAARAGIIKADVLLKYGHHEEALAEATKARDAKDANAFERELAKGKMIEIMTTMADKKDPTIVFNSKRPTT